MKKKIAEIYVEELDNDVFTHTVTFCEGYDTVRKLGVLEIAKVSIMEASSRDIALMEYNEEEL